MRFESRQKKWKQLGSRGGQVLRSQSSMTNCIIVFFKDPILYILGDKGHKPMMIFMLP